MPRRILLWLAALILALAMLCCGTAEERDDGNLLFNPGFEIIGEDGLPEGWDIDAYMLGTWDTEFSIDRQFTHNGNVSVQLVNYEPNDARFVQIVEVEPECMYRLSGWISADEISNSSPYYQYGANLSIINGSLTNTHTRALTETDGDWVYVETYGETGPDQYEVQVCARLGGFSGTAVGTAWFDDLCLEQVWDLPAGVVADLWFDARQTDTDDDFSGWDDGYDSFDNTELYSNYNNTNANKQEPRVSTRPWLYVIAALWVMFAMVLMLLMHQFHRKSRKEARWQIWWIWPVLVLGLILRLALALGILRFDGASGIRLVLFPDYLNPEYSYSLGYAVDTNCFRLWSSHLSDPETGVGCAGFYAYGYFCDYPPLSMLINGGLQRIAWGLENLIQQSWPEETIIALTGTANGHVYMNWLEDAVLKLPAILADLGIAWLVGHEAVKRGKGRAFSGLLVALVALNPAMILNSACWGQVDSVLAFAIVAVAVFAMRRNWIALMPVYMLAVLYKPQALMLGPLGLVVIIIELVRHPESWWRMVIGTVLAVGVALAVILPFSPNQEWTWIFDKYGETLSSYPYVTVNTANLYYIFDLNWEKIETGTALWPILCLAVLSIGWLSWLCVQDRKRGIRRTAAPAIILGLLGVNFALAGVFGEALVIPDLQNKLQTLISYGSMNYSVMALCLFIAIHLWCRSRRLDTLPLCGALLFMLLYTFGCRMHERYVFPALALLALACAVRHDPRQLVMLLLVTFTFFLNEGIVLDNSMTLGYLYGHLNADTELLAKILSGLNLTAVLLGLWTAYDLCSVPGNDIPVRRRSEVLKGGKSIHE
ncbi:MAG: hypothetical protein IK127_04690 [Clostridia bacterium]|nr:hypothetical protein [Clostridia bacterium]